MSLLSRLLISVSFLCVYVCLIRAFPSTQTQTGVRKVKGEVKTQLIAHDQEVFDIAFAKGVNIFASVGADGSVRMFDLR